MGILETAAKAYVGHKMGKDIGSAFLSDHESIGEKKEEQSFEQMKKNRLKEELKEYGFNPLRLSTAIRALEEFLTKKNVHHELALAKYIQERENFIKERALGQLENQREHLQGLKGLEMSKNQIIELGADKISLEWMKDKIHENMINLVREHEHNLDIKLENELGLKIAELFEDDALIQIVMSSKPGESNQAAEALSNHTQIQRKEIVSMEKKKERKEKKLAFKFLRKLTHKNFENTKDRLQIDDHIQNYFPDIFEKYASDVSNTRETFIDGDFYTSLFTKETLTKIMPEVLEHIKHENSKE